MITFPAYAAHFEVYPKEGKAFRHLSPLIARLKQVDFAFRVDDPTVNQGQMVSDFDRKFEQALHKLGAAPCQFCLPKSISQELDFVFTFDGCTVAVEIEKSNREKILRDILKCHMYLHSGADFALVALPKNYPHTHGIWNLFDFGIQQFSDCNTYGLGTADKFGRILLLGFEQFDALTKKPLSQKTRQQMRKQAASQT